MVLAGKAVAGCGTYGPAGGKYSSEAEEARAAVATGTGSTLAPGQEKFRAGNASSVGSALCECLGCPLVLVPCSHSESFVGYEGLEGECVCMSPTAHYQWGSRGFSRQAE
jgi:hypothetical protein